MTGSLAPFSVDVPPFQNNLNLFPVVQPLGRGSTFCFLRRDFRVPFFFFRFFKLKSGLSSAFPSMSITTHVGRAVAVTLMFVCFRKHQKCAVRYTDAPRETIAPTCTVSIEDSLKCSVSFVLLDLACGWIRNAEASKALFFF